ncbi:MAG: glycosyltransferase family 4 protein [Planctomycetaceae bacterium]
MRRLEAVFRAGIGPITQVQEKINKPRLLICADWFDPGVGAGGPIRSCVNLAMLLGANTRVSIITSDRDLGADAPYPETPSNRWLNWHGRVTVVYCSSVCRRLVSLAATLRRHPPDALYLNSVFSFAGTLWPLFWTCVTRSRTRVVLAPRGMLKMSAFMQKRWKKQPLIFLMKATGLVRNVVFQATSRDEINEIKAVFGDVAVRLVPNVPATPVDAPPRRLKCPGSARLCFIGRVHPTKNLLWLLEAMKQLPVECRLTVVGPVEDASYYEKCASVIDTLPQNVTVDFAGSQSEAEIGQLLVRSDAMVLPTLGENFGHAIFESLAQGTPVIISDRTIWRDLKSKQAGWDLSLDQPAGMISVIEALAAMSQQQHEVLREGALKVASDFVNQYQFADEYHRLFFDSGEPR